MNGSADYTCDVVIKQTHQENGTAPRHRLFKQPKHKFTAVSLITNALQTQTVANRSFNFKYLSI